MGQHPRERDWQFNFQHHPCACGFSFGPKHRSEFCFVISMLITDCAERRNNWSVTRILNQETIMVHEFLPIYHIFITIPRLAVVFLGVVFGHLCWVLLHLPPPRMPARGKWMFRNLHPWWGVNPTNSNCWEPLLGGFKYVLFSSQKLRKWSKHQLSAIMVNWWFGAWWFGFLGFPLWKGLLLTGTPIQIPNHRAPNHQFTISWNWIGMFFSQKEQLRALGERVERSDWDVKLSQIRQARWVCRWFFLHLDGAWKSKSPLWKGKSSEAHLHFWGSMLIFRGVFTGRNG